MSDVTMGNSVFSENERLSWAPFAISLTHNPHSSEQVFLYGRRKSWTSPKGQVATTSKDAIPGQRILFLGNTYNRVSVECLKALVELGHHPIVGSYDASAQGAWELIRNRFKVRGASFVFRQAIQLASARIGLIFRRTGGRRRRFDSLLELCQAYELKMIACTNPNSPEFVQQVRALEVELIVVAAFGRILTRALLESPRAGCVNVHASLLPRYRGPEPFYWVLANNEETTGVTIHYIDQGIDTGDVILQKEFEIVPGETEITLKERSVQVAAKLLREAIPLLLSGRAPRVAQDHSAASYYSFPPRGVSAARLSRRTRSVVGDPNRAFLDHFRCPDDFASFGVNGELSKEEGFFRFGGDTICYGQLAGTPSSLIAAPLPDASKEAKIEDGQILLPFNISQVTENLRNERYVLHAGRSLRTLMEESFIRNFYYFFRPILPIAVRKHLQRARFKGWDRIPFPHWPVDFTVESLLDHAMTLALRTQPDKTIPFIWFWPAGAKSCVLMTHDVEASAGRDFCTELMDMDDSFGIKSAFQIVPEVRYEAPIGFLEAFRERDFEVNIHDLNHDGALFQDRQEFLRRADRINRFAKEFHTRGFRAGSMYRKQEWFNALDVSYDMSVPNVAHLEPQRGGCCTVMPYFIGDILELPLTTAQDYALFHILGDYSIELWKKQIDLIRGKHGLISFITHPDYLIEKRARQVYRDLLDHLSRLRTTECLWIALPREVDRWWRNRSQMKLVRNGASWQIEGPDKDRACVAYARLENDQLVYSVEPTS
jgi:folate-dependent phosphoribosylglycinamide formyltransferase PurN